jgi:ribosomal protein L11 methyltransferase
MESMRWVELSVKANQDEADGLASLLAEYGQGGAAVEEWPGNGVTEKEYTVKIYLPYNRAFKEKKSRIKQLLQSKYGLNRIQFKEKFSRQEDWFSSIKRQFNILEVGHSLIIKASWCERPVSSWKKVVVLDPGYAFGTGLHPTTRLCLTHMEKDLRPGMTVLDLGTGSGILAIAAARFGASHVVALDTDPNAVQAAKNNFKSNSVEDIILLRRGTLSLRAQRDWKASFDLVAANITSKIIADLAQALSLILKSSGIVIASGINAQGLDEVLIRMVQAGLRIEGIYSEGEWYAVVGRKGDN